MMLLNWGSRVPAAIQGNTYTEILFAGEDHYFYIKVSNNGNREIKMHAGEGLQHSYAPFRK